MTTDLGLDLLAHVSRKGLGKRVSMYLRRFCEASVSGVRGPLSAISFIRVFSFT